MYTVCSPTPERNISFIIKSVYLVNITWLKPCVEVDSNIKDEVELHGLLKKQYTNDASFNFSVIGELVEVHKFAE